MKNQDSVKFVGELLFINFDATGTSQRASVFNVAKGATFHVDNNAIYANTHADHQTNILVEGFANESQTWNGLDLIQSTMIARAKRGELAGIARTLARYVGIPAGLVFLVAAVTGTVNAHYGTASTRFTSDENLVAAQVPASLAQPPMTQPVQGANTTNGLAPLAVKPDVIAAALKGGVAAGHYAVKLGSATGDPVYVFEDPQCSHCQAFSPELNKLAKTHPVYVYPVSIIGGDSSAALNAVTLCAPADKRETTWNMALTGALSIPGPGKPDQPSDACVKAAAANDVIVKAMNVPGTPTLFDTHGNQMPYTIHQNAQDISAWLASNAQVTTGG